MLEKNGSVTLLDVARAAGVSIKTASRALNNAPELRKATGDHVREVMQQLGYQPNELARGLKSRRSATIAMIAPNLADPFTAAAVQAVQDVAREHRYVVILASSGGDAALELSEVEIMARRQIDGLILIAATSGKNTLKGMLAKDVPVVVFDEPVRGEEVDTITVTNRKGARQATEHLLGHGHRRILAVGARPYLYTCSERVAGYRAAMRSAGAEPVELLVKHENELTSEALAPYLSGPCKVEAIIGLNWVCTMGVLRGLNTFKKRLGEEFAFISFDDFELAEMIPPGLTVVRQPTRELGRQAASLLFERIAEKSHGEARKVVLSTEFVIRGSCGCTPT
ncbi:LacI family DNA-binding transcriptional regulator [Occallatibacter riparius]|uniref:LacI family transcriptional regulator n=1 Tax=Occallatibacter riparius TaxID=1002689 RepID=A0A9J7BSI3_9BACT|nr:LacI family DNA-binding transcriptional regulator [Occallatibacter riparius]UWZ85836.1 LacI family transcriptional regulator [Occallatibacter riparius]